MAMNNGNSSVRVRRFVMLSPTQVDKSGFFQSLDEFMRCHDMPIRIMRIEIKKKIRSMRIQ